MIVVRLQDVAQVVKLKEPIVKFSDFSFDHVIADKAAVMEINPHRFELRLLDGILMSDEKRAVGFYDVPADAFWMRGHFPDRPLMPGVLIAEVAAQLTSYIASTTGMRGDAVIGLAGLDKIRFRSQVAPGDRLTVMVEILKVRTSTLIVTQFQAYVGHTLSAEGQITGISMSSAG